MNMSDTSQWHPIAASTDLVARHVFHGKLLGHEFAVWRADDGNVNVWENRCLHRGVRLSIGMNDGAELKCQYHGWRYANGSASCTYIPAHPANSPARQVTNRTFPAVERFGLVWSTLQADEPFAAALPDGEWLALRAVAVNASCRAVLDALVEAAAATSLRWLSPLALELEFRDAPGEPVITFIQPVDAASTVIRSSLGAQPADEQMALRRFDRILTDIRDRAEASALPDIEPLEAEFAPVSSALAAIPAAMPTKMTAVVTRKWQAGEDVTALELTPLSGSLPAFQPGAHIDLTLSDGTVRQYSLTNGPGAWHSWTIGVKRDANSRGGSRAIADLVREGDLLGVSEPRNKFPLRRDATKSILIAGGIGVTPLIAMAKALQHGAHGFEFHVFARTLAHVPFGDQLRKFGGALHLHLGRDPQQTRSAIQQLLGPYAFSLHAYVCGPGPMIDAVIAEAGVLGWPEDAIHYEHFTNEREIDTSSAFTVELARSALTVEVPAGTSILSAVRATGVDIASSCERGAFGTCVADILEGIPDHQDVYLNRSEKAANRCIVTCVSRSLSKHLVLDL